MQGRVAHLAVAVLLAIGTVAIAGLSTWLGYFRSGYRPLEMSMSILGERGSNGAELFNAAVVLPGAVLILTGVVVRRTAPGVWIALAGVAIVALALVPIDAGSYGVTLVHRGLTGCALLSLVLALLRAIAADGWFVSVSRVVRWLAAIGLALGAGLLVEGFPGGAWERATFALLLGWVELYLIHLIQASAGKSAASAAS